MEELATILRRERWLLSVLVFRLTELHHLLEANDARFLGWAAAEVEDATDRVREAGVMRAALVSGVTPDAGDTVYGEIIAEHELAIDGLVAEVQALTERSRRAASAAIEAF